MIHDVTNLDYPSNSRRCTSKKPTGNNIICQLYQAFDSMHREKMEQILPAFDLPKETVAAIMMLHWITKVKVRYPDGDIDYIDIVAVMLQVDTFAPYFFTICLDYILRKSIDKIKDSGFKLKKEAAVTPHNQFRIRTTSMTERFCRIHPLKPKPCYTVWNKQLLARLPCQCTQDETHALYSKWWHLHTNR